MDFGGSQVGQGHSHSLGLSVPRKLSGEDVVRHIRLARQVEEVRKEMEKRECEVEQYR